MNEQEKNIKSQFGDILGDYGIQLSDSSCGEPIAWGFRLNKKCDSETWANLKKHGELFFTGDPYSISATNWSLLTKKLTREEAIEKYGSITNEEFGPQGGWKSVTFGKKHFVSNFLRP